MSTSYEPGAPTGGDSIPLCVPEIRGNEWQYVKDCLDTGWVSSVGAYVTRFEEMVAAQAEVGHAVAAVNGTAALHIALLVAGVQPGDEVLVSDMTFIAPANAIRYAGAFPVFIDANPQTWQMDMEQVAYFLEEHCALHDGVLRNTSSGRPVRAVVPVHILGHPVDMDPLLALAERFGLALIEDATESLGASYRGRAVGSLGHIACFSFNGNKLITTGGGGMIVTDNAAWAQQARYLSTQAKDDPLEYIHGEVGYNYRLTNILAAMGCAQMEQLGDYIASKRAIAARYDAALGELPGITLLPRAEWAEGISWLYTIQIDPAQFGMDSRALLRLLAEQQIQSRPLWHPMHLNAPMQGFEVVGGEVALHLNRTCLSIPCSVGLTEAQQERVIGAIRAAHGA